MRGFWLKDEYGAIKALQGGGVFYNLPTGLGFTLTDSFNHLGDGVFSRAESQSEKQTRLSGELVFTAGGQFEDAASQYGAFIDWLLVAKELTLLYDPGGDLANAMCRAVEITTLEKSELTAGALVCPVVIDCLEPWHRRDVRALAMTASGAALTLTPSVGGHMPAAFYLEVTGGLQYPEVVVTQGGTELGRCKVNSTFATDEALILDTRPGSPGVWRRTSAGTLVDRMQYVYLDYDPFPLLPVGYDTTITVTNNSTTIGAGSVKIFEYYRSY